MRESPESSPPQSPGAVPFAASLAFALKTLRQAPAPVPAAASPAVCVDLAARGAWTEAIARNIALYDDTPPDFDALAEVTRPGRLAAPAGALVPDQILLPFLGVAPFFVRCLAALAASGLGDTGVTLVDTGTADADAARLAAYCQRLGMAVSMNRAQSREAFNRHRWIELWGGTPRYVLVLNSDTVPTPGFAAKLFQAMDDRPNLKSVSAVSTNRLDAFIHRPGFEEGPEETLLERTWQFHRLMEATRTGIVSPCPYSSMTCAAFSWAAWSEVAPGATPFDYDHHYDLHIGCLLREADYGLGVREDCAVYHIGHATYREVGATELYDSILDRTLQYIDRWGHLPEHYDLMHELLYLSDRYHH